jgi:hypothetical protein
MKPIHPLPTTNLYSEVFHHHLTYLFTRDDKDYYLRMFPHVPMEDWAGRPAGMVVEILPSGSLHHCQLRQQPGTYRLKSPYWRRMADAVRRAVELGVLDKAQADAVLS